MMLHYAHGSFSREFEIHTILIGDRAASLILGMPSLSVSRSRVAAQHDRWSTCFSSIHDMKFLTETKGGMWMVKHARFLKIP
jgi:hypothetical protein